MTHVSRLSEELVLWMNPRFGFVDIADRFCTGSSIMPQKKNPDVPGAHARQDRPRLRRPGGAAHGDEGRSRWPTTRTTRKTRSRCSTRSTRLRDVLAILAELLRGSRRRGPSACARRSPKASRPRPTSPTTWCARALPSAMPTKRSRARCAQPKTAGKRPRRAPAARRCRRFSPLIGDGRLRGPHRRRARSPRAGTSAGRRPRPFAPRSPGRRSAALGRLSSDLRLVDAAELARLRARKAVAHLPAAVDALRELLAVARRSVHSPNIAPSLSSCSVTSASRSAEMALRMRLGLMLRVAFCQASAGWASRAGTARPPTTGAAAPRAGRCRPRIAR